MDRECGDAFSEENQMLGQVKWFTDVGGYGFIERCDGPDVIVHYTAIVGERVRP